MNLVKRSRPRGVIVVAFLMILFGLAEVVTGFTHQFFGVTTANGTTSAYAGALIGVLYAAAGLLVLIMKKWAATLAIVCLAADVVGRVAMVFTGLYPVGSPAQTFAIVTGTAIVVAFGIYILSKWRAFE
jgi:peptidoglycan/LPS O-acetylase OafA/YrhL